MFALEVVALCFVGFLVAIHGLGWRQCRELLDPGCRLGKVDFVPHHNRTRIFLLYSLAFPQEALLPRQIVLVGIVQLVSHVS